MNGGEELLTSGYFQGVGENLLTMLESMFGLIFNIIYDFFPYIILFIIIYIIGNLEVGTFNNVFNKNSIKRRKIIKKNKLKFKQKLAINKKLDNLGDNVLKIYNELSMDLFYMKKSIKIYKESKKLEKVLKNKKSKNINYLFNKTIGLK